MGLLTAWQARASGRDFSPPQLLDLIEYAMMGLVGMGGIALAWALAAPTGSSARQVLSTASVDRSPAAFTRFDPFFRLSGEGPSAVVTALDLTLYGVRADRASGRGAAIIGRPDSAQNSYAVGDAIMPGVVLAAVAFDSVSIRRNGALEKLYLDQSRTVPTTDGAGPAAADPFNAIRAVPGNRSVGTASLMAGILLSPRARGGRVDGYILQPSADGAAFRTAGLKPGDVLVSINGARIADGVGAQQFAQAIEGPGPVTLDIERDGRPVMVSIGRPQ